jgi:hypothetical protein
VVTGFLIGILLIGTGAFAAWIVQSGQLNGGGKIAALPTITQSGGSILVTDLTATNGYNQSSQDACVQGANCDVLVRVNASASLKLVSTTSVGFGPVPSGCAASNFTGRNQTGLSIPVPAGVSYVLIPGQVTLAAAAPTACAGGFFGHDLTATFEVA